MQITVGNFSDDHVFNFSKPKMKIDLYDLYEYNLTCCSFKLFIINVERCSK